MTPEARREYHKLWREKNPDYHRAYQEDKLSGTFEKKMRKLLFLAKGRAKKKGIEFSITIDDVLKVTHCPLLGIPLDFAKRGKGSADNSPTLDRIDPTKGYVPGNVWLISAKANRMKSDATYFELELLVANLRIKLGV